MAALLSRISRRFNFVGHLHRFYGLFSSAIFKSKSFYHNVTSKMVLRCSNLYNQVLLISFW